MLAAVEPWYVLAHAPLVGPSTWRWAADVLATEGRGVAVPDLHGAPEPSRRGYIAQIASAIPTSGEVVLVGHSGSGPLLPFAAAAARTAAHVTFVFVDAGLPPLGGDSRDEHPVLRAAGLSSRAPSFAHRVQPDGHLPPWHTWWGEDGMARLVPDHNRRAEITADIPRLPLAFYDEGAPVPTGWAEAPAGYVLLSETYRLWADAALSYAWPVEEVPGTHLEIVNSPSAVAAAIVRVAAAARAS
jgi:hypothetical protein